MKINDVANHVSLTIEALDNKLNQGRITKDQFDHEVYKLNVWATKELVGLHSHKFALSGVITPCAGVSEYTCEDVTVEHIEVKS